VCSILIYSSAPTIRFLCVVRDSLSDFTRVSVRFEFIVDIVLYILTLLIRTYYYTFEYIKNIFPLAAKWPSRGRYPNFPCPVRIRLTAAVNCALGSDEWGLCSSFVHPSVMSARSSTLKLEMSNPAAVRQSDILDLSLRDSGEQWGRECEQATADLSYISSIIFVGNVCGERLVAQYHRVQELT